MISTLTSFRRGSRRWSVLVAVTSLAACNNSATVVAAVPAAAICQAPAARSTARANPGCKTISAGDVVVGGLSAMQAHSVEGLSDEF
jgi:hypothetical protein